MVSVLVWGSSGPGSRSGREHCVVFVDNTLLLSPCLSPPRCIQLFRQGLFRKSVKAHATMPIGKMGSKSLALLD